ncbi:YidC/Oxa1 family insertase periplasmic-domain containing protein [Candidatus Latescibacterota bacterium]
MDKNFIIAIVLTTIMILIFTSPQYHERFGTERPAAPSVESTQTADPVERPRTTASSTITSGAQDTNITEVSDKTPPPAETVQVNTPSGEKDIILENEDIIVTISTRGAVITSASMKNYKGGDEDSLAQLVKDGESWNSGFLSDGDFVLNFTDLIFHEQSVSKNSVFLYAELSEKRTLTLAYTLDDTGYMVHASSSVDGPWDNPTLRFAWNGPVNHTEKEFKMIKVWPLSLMMRDTSKAFNKVVYLGQGDRLTVNGSGKEDSERIYSDESSQKLDAAKHKSGGKDFFEGDLNWYAVRSKYFMTAAIPKDIKRWTAESSCFMTGTEKWYDFSISKQVADGATNLDIYIGPISYDTLKDYNANLTELMELSFRIFRPISISFLWLFKNIHRFIPNWGIVIIVFSIIIKLVLFPLSHKSFVSMRKMSELQPQISALREKHSTNPANLHKATMDLYKQEGVNPFSGCLPMLLQMPVFLALYPVIGRSVELRQAMFIPHWIEDLSMPDQFYILPIAMGLSMFFQSKQTMKDPNQKAMVYIMPVLMVILFANFSSGLTLYWFLFNVMTVAQQKFHIGT